MSDIDNISSSSESDVFFSCESSTDGFDVSVDAVHLGDLIQDTFCTYPNNLNVCHINAQSIPCHYSDLFTTFNSESIHAVLVSETFLKPSLQSTSYSLPGFVLVRNDRIGKRCGGVAIYVRSNFKYKIISQSPSNYTSSSEHLFLEIILKNTKFLLGVVYAPPTVDYFAALEILLETHLPSYEHNLIMGDFNTCLLKNDNRTKKLKHISTSLNVTILPLNSTFHLNNCNSLLDLILTSNPERIASHGQHLAPGFSHHDLIFASYKIKAPKYKPKVFLQRNFARMNLEKLSSDASNTDWNTVFAADAVDDKVNIFNKLLIKLYDKHAPIHPVRMKRPPAPWLNDDIRKAMRWRDSLRRKHKKTPSEVAWNNFKSARNRVNQMCRNAKRQYIHKAIETCTQQNIWKFLGTLGLGKPKAGLNYPDLNLNDLNLHFSSIPITINSSQRDTTIKQINSKPLPNITSFQFHAVSVSEVDKIIKSVVSKAVGFDDVGRVLLVPILNVILPVLTHIINSSLTSGCYPEIWKNAHIVPLPKKSNPTAFSQLRPISILPYLSKILERVVHQQFSLFLIKHNLLNPYQSGFRPAHSTTTALIKITDDIRLAMNDKQLTLLTLLDFSSAFNCVDHDILMAILRSLNISENVTQWFCSYLSGRRQRVRLDNVYSDWCPVSAGVPQGGVLSPLLFSLFINSLVQVITFSSYHLYADDLQLSLNFSLENLNDSISMMNNDLEAVRVRSGELGLLVNPAKTQVMLMGTRYMLDRIDLGSISPLTFNCTLLPFCQHVKNLGLHMTCDLSWECHVSEVSKKVFATMHSLRQQQHFIPFEAKRMLVTSLLLPIIDYADICYTDISEELLNKLDRLLNLCIRYMYGLKKYDHVSHYRKELEWLNIRSRRSVHLLSFLYNILFNPMAPSYLKTRFQFLCDSHNCPLRSTHNNQLKIPAHATSRYSNSYTISAARQWNMLPLSIRQAPSIHIFKNLLNKHFIIKQNIS